MPVALVWGRRREQRVAGSEKTNKGDKAMKKTMMILAGSFLGALAFTGMNQAEARGYHGRKHRTRTVTRTRTTRTRRGHVRTRTRVTTRTWTSTRRRASARTSRRYVRNHRRHVRNSRRYYRNQRRHARKLRRYYRNLRRYRNYRRSRLVWRKVYNLKPYLGRRAYRILNRRYNGNVRLFCINKPRRCNVTFTRVRVWY